MFNATPAARRRPSLTLLICTLAMPASLYGIPLLTFGLIFAGTRPPQPAQYWTFTAVLACQVIAYAWGVNSLIRLGKCPPPATTFGKWFTRTIGTLFIVGGGIWALSCVFMQWVITTQPW